MSVPEEHLEALLVSVLAVNNYGLQKAHDLLPSLRKSSLTNPNLVVNEDVGRLTAMLYQAGYDRGLLTGLMAERYAALMKDVLAGKLDQLDQLVKSNAASAAKTLLMTLHGVGPRVASDAWMLMRSK